MGARGCLGMELDSPYVFREMPDTGYRSVIEMSMGDLQIGRKPLLLDGIAVILRCDEDAPGS